MYKRQAEDGGRERLQRDLTGGPLQARRGERGEEHRRQRGQRTRQTPGERTHPGQAYAHERGRLQVLPGGPQGQPPAGVPEQGEDAGDGHRGHRDRGEPAVGDRHRSDPGHRVTPGIAQHQQVATDAPGQIGEQHDVDTDRDDGLDVRGVRVRVSASQQQPVDGAGEDGGGEDAHREGSGEAEVVVQDGGEVAAEQEQGAVGEVQDARRLEDDDEAECDQGVDRAEREPAQQVVEQTGHAAPSRAVPR